jgi:hypothetical protein
VLLHSTALLPPKAHGTNQLHRKSLSATLCWLCACRLEFILRAHDVCLIVSNTECECWEIPGNNVGLVFLSSASLGQDIPSIFKNDSG